MKIFPDLGFDFGQEGPDVLSGGFGEELTIVFPNGFAEKIKNLIDVCDSCFAFR